MSFTAATLNALRQLATSTPMMDSATVETLSLIMQGGQYEAAMQGLEDLKYGRMITLADAFADVEGE